MFEHTEKVVLAGKEYPIRCDINVLAEIQEEFDTISNFEMLLAGMKVRKDKDGNALLDHDGRIMFDRCDPSVRAIAVILPCMLKEACGGDDIGEALGAVKNARFDLYDTALQMYKELEKCFERKNV